jgi:hypothetical protein
MDTLMDLWKKVELSYAVAAQVVNVSPTFARAIAASSR